MALANDYVVREGAIDSDGALVAKLVGLVEGGHPGVRTKTTAFRAGKAPEVLLASIPYLSDGLAASVYRLVAVAQHDAPHGQIVAPMKPGDRRDHMFAAEAAPRVFARHPDLLEAIGTGPAGPDIAEYVASELRYRQHLWRRRARRAGRG